ncbi:MAG: hypothetical protein IIB53_15765 [Planctomycetes bacterium]|nr:hypothetical protein [Planctomycetota bacterium]
MKRIRQFSLQTRGVASAFFGRQTREKLKISDDQRMAMLFWLEFLHQENEEVRKQYEDVLIPPEDATVDGLTIPERDLIDQEIAGLGIRPQLADGLGSELQMQRLNYSRLKRRISRFVLPAMSIRSNKPIDSP